ncbi:beta-ketoacyl-ACP synthase II [Holospora curviuscula]|uniref:3-oxoacyl-[acyl-carrier-protein] synthase 2 n=1 Tax=Holospora curviuscula TaxID=1082868 RepID=A0A2S5RE17_9PROT|nr:beta-ketoacyl-ACP synthase II [Holospora curviuscula]PPE05589.1 3-oxoacyl-[acyl-carrier-protein] synthase 2 [Holospora curviuscula]
MTRRVVVTGVSVISPLGMGADWVWNRLIEGKSGIRTIDLGDEEIPCKIAGIIPEGTQEGELNFGHWIKPGELRRMDRFIALSVVSSQEALQDSGFDPRSDPERTAVFFGAGIGGLPFIEKNVNALACRYKDVSPFFVPGALINLTAGQIGVLTGAKGPSMGFATACAASAHALGESFWAIKNGRADVIISGGSEATVCKIGIAGFSAMKALSVRNQEPEKASRPWDKHRDGFVMGEGAATLILEHLDHAKKRNAKIYAELVGYGATGDAYHITATSGEGAYRSMKEALQVADITPEALGYINAHGTSTPLGDKVELEAVERLFENVSREKLPLMSSTKSATGHLLGASGALEAFFSIMALRHQIVPATLNLTSFEPTQRNLGIDLVPCSSRSVAHLRYVLSNSFGFGGTNASLIFKAWDS